MKKRRIMVPIILLALACPVIPGFDSGLKVRCYTVESDAVQAPVRVALISDLHSCGYGENQRELIDAVDSQNPDLVLMTGDIFDDELPDDNTEQFLRGVGKRYPCYYVTGNHEHWSGSGAFLEKWISLRSVGSIGFPASVKRFRFVARRSIFAGLTTRRPLLPLLRIQHGTR